jgi:hypothetical protein
MAPGLLNLAPPSDELFSLPRDSCTLGWGGDIRTTLDIPPGFPLATRSACAWGASRLPQPDDYIWSFASADIAEVEAAMASFKGLFRCLVLSLGALMT